MATKTVTLVTPPTRTGDTVASYNIYSDETGLLDNATPAELAGGHVVSLADGTDHDIYVKTVWTTYGESAQGSNAPLVDLSIIPPTVLAVGTPTYNTIPLTWTKTVTGAMTSYKVYDDGVLLQTFAGDVALGTLTGLTPATAYTNLTVRAFNGTYESASSNAVTGTTAAFVVPSGLTVGTPTSTTIPLTWTKSTSGVMTSYKVYDDGVLLQTFAGDVALGTLTGLTPETAYTNLTVRAYNGTIESASSNTVNATTTVAPVIEVPTSLAVGTPTYNSIPLTWTKSITGVMTEYRAYVGGVLTQTFSGDVALGTLTGLAPSITYSTITVRAYDGSDESDDSNAVNGTTAAFAVPTSLTVGTPTSTTIPLTWTKSTTGVMQSYKVYDDNVLLQTFAGDVAAGTLTGLTASTTYTNLTVRAYDGTLESGNSNAVNGTTTSAADTKGLDLSNATMTNITVPGTMSRTDDIKLTFGSVNLGTPAASQYIMGHGGNGDGLTHWALKWSPTDTTKILLRYNATNTSEVTVGVGTIARLLVESDGVSLWINGVLHQKITASTATLSTSEAGFSIGSYSYSSVSFFSDFKLQRFEKNTEVFACEEGTGNTTTGSLGTVCATTAGSYAWYNI